MQQKWREGAADTSRAQACGRHRWFPGQLLISDQTTRQPQLPQTSRQQPGPHLTCARVSGSNRGPAKLVLTKTKALLDREATSVPVRRSSEERRVGKECRSQR